jgi:hypothetical protein
MLNRMGPMGHKGPMMESSGFGNREQPTANSEPPTHSGESFPNMLTQCLTVDAASGFLGRNFHDLAELRL